MNRIQHIVSIVLLLLTGAIAATYAQNPRISIKGNMYGGGQLAKVAGNTEVTLKEGTLQGELYGAGKGMTAEQMASDIKNPDTKVSLTADEKLAVASVGGTTDVAVGKTNAAYAQGIDYSKIAPINPSTLQPYYVAAPHDPMVLNDVEQKPVIERGSAIVLGNIYGGGEMAQVLGHVNDAKERLVTSALGELLVDINASIPTAYEKSVIRTHKKTLDVKLYGGAEIYGKVFGGGKGCENFDLADAASVTGQTRVLLDGARAWSALFGGAAEATVHGNTMVHLLRGVVGHDVVGGGLGHQRSQTAITTIHDPLATAEQINFSNADVMKVTSLTAKDGSAISFTEDEKASLTGNTFVIVGDGNTVDQEELTINLAYSLKEEKGTDGRVINDKVYTGNDVEDFAQNCDPSVSPFGTDKPYYKIQFTPGVIKFDINHNIYGGGMTASVVNGSTNVHIARGMLRDSDLYCKVPAVLNKYGQNPWQTNWENLASPYFGIFGGGFGKPSHVKGDTHVTVAIDPAGISTSDLATHITDIQKDDYSEDDDREARKLYGHNARTYCDVLGGGFNGDVYGTTHVKVGYNTYLRKVYGGGLYSPVGATDILVKNGVIDYVFGGGMIGDVNNQARMAIGTRDITRAKNGGSVGSEATDFEENAIVDGNDDDIRNSKLADMTPYEPDATRAERMNKYLLIRKGIYGGNDVAGTVGIIQDGDPLYHKQTVKVKTYNLHQKTTIYATRVEAETGSGTPIGESSEGDYNYTIYETTASGPRQYFEVPVRIQELSRDNGTKVYARVEVSNKNQQYETEKYIDADGNEQRIPKDSPKSEETLSELSGLADPLEGVNLAIFGGTVLGDVYGAGNGAHTGYSDPNNCLFTDSDPSNDTYYLRPLYGKYMSNVLNVKNASKEWVDVESLDHDERIEAANANPTEWGKVYKSRPRTAHVEMYVYGNSTTDRVNIKGKTFGGGNSCNVGQWHTQMSGIHDVDKPELYIGGGKLTMNIGSHVILGKDPTEDDKAYTINGLFMGCNGELLATQPENMEDAKYYHRYFQGIIDTRSGKTDYNYSIGTSKGTRIVATTEDNYEGTIAYWPGFMLYGDNVNSQQIALEAYLKNIEMDADVILNIPKTATDIAMSSFVGGGFRGSMSASNANRTPYDYTLPAGVTVRDRIIGGCYNAFVKYYEYHVAGKVTNDDAYQNQKIENDYLTYYLIPDIHNPGQLAYQKTNLVQTSVFGGFTGGVVGKVNHDLTDSHIDRSFARLKGLEKKGSDEAKNHFRDAYIQLHLYNKVLPHVEYTLNKEKPIYSEPQHKRDKDGNPLYYGTTTDAEGNVVVDKNVETTDYSPFPVMTEPELLGYAHENTRAWGGNVYGGCYNSGFVHGDIVVDYHCNIDEEAFKNMYSGDELIDEYGQQYFTTYSPGTYQLAADLDNNDCLRVYGAGYGDQTEVYGDAFVLVHAVDDASYDSNKSTPHVFNVFGGSEKGTLVGDTYLFYDGGKSLDGKEGAIFGSMYGGGMQGDLVRDYKIHQGTIYDNYIRDAYAVESGSSFVEAIGGKVHGIYGGARQANMEGGAIVWCHEPASAPDPETHIGLMAGIVCGGTDVAGAITGHAQNYRAVPKLQDADNPGFYQDKDPVLIEKLEAEREASSNGMDWRSRPSTWVRIGGNKSILEPASAMDKAAVNTAASASTSFHRGYPLIGTVYAGGNGEMYNDYMTHHGTLPAPDVDYAVLDITGGTMAHAFGGANMATIKRHTYINVENAFTRHQNDPALSRQENMADVNDPRAKKDYIATFNVANQDQLRFIREEFLGIYAHEVKPLGSGDYTLNYQTLRLFGGNNESDMAIQPSWNMISGHLGSVYSGGNRGRMTYYNPGKLNDCSLDTWIKEHGSETGWEAHHANYFETRGICLTVASSDMYIDEIYGGCRMSDVMAAQVQLRNDAGTQDLTADESKAIYDAKNLLNHTDLDNRGSYNAATDSQGTMIQLTDDNGDLILANFFELYPIVTDDNSPRELYDQDFYGATLKILDGHFNSVYGGNDVAGNIYNGSRLFVAGAISGDIYGAGNGNYFYQYADDALISDEIKEKYATGIDAGGNKYIDRIVELYDADLWNPKTATGHGNAYFILPKMPDTHVYHDMPTTDATDLQKILAINSMRPNVAKAYLDIEGRPGTSETVYVTGSVYCGGNSSTITRMTFNTEQPIPTTRFNMGDNVTLNNVFMGSNGENMRNPNYLEGMERLNGLDLTAATVLDTKSNPTDDPMVGGVKLSIDDKIIAGYNTEGEQMPDQYGKTFTENVYPHLVDVFMRGVEMDALPVGFNNMASLINEYTKAFVGDFCLGGNAGSMMVGKKVTMTLPYSLKIFGNVIGGCKDTNFSYRGVKHVGGFLMPLNDYAKDDDNYLIKYVYETVDGVDTRKEVSTTYKTLSDVPELERKALKPNTTKIDLNVQSQFINRFMDVSAQDTPSGDLFLVNNQYFASDPGVSGAVFEKVTDTYGRLYYDNYTDAIRTAELQSSWLGEGCNVYGGCYQSGTIVGDVHIDIYSDMFAKVARDKNSATPSLYSFGWEKTKINGTDINLGFKDLLERTAEKNKNHEMSAFGVYGGGFGADTRVLGDTHIHTRHYGVGAHDEEHPSMTNIFGGGRSGVVVGNSDIRVQDGYITGDVVGGSDASTFYGSTQIMVGYPKHYIAKKTGKYHLKRGDRWNLDRNKTIVKNNVPSDVPVINQDVFYREGDIIPANVAEQIVGLYEYDGLNTDGTIKYKDFKDLEHEPRFLNSDGTFSDAAVHNAENAYFKIIDEVAKPTKEHGMFPDQTNYKWDDNSGNRLVDIRILGGVYGGGYTVASSLNTTAGTYTVLKYDDVDTHAVGYVDQSILNTASNLAYTKNIYTKNFDETSGDTFNKEYGGNATIIVTDDTNPTNNTRRDHIRISHIVANEKTLKKGENHLSYFKVAKNDGGNTITDGFGNTLYETLTNYEITEDDVTAGKNKVIELSGDGGIFGDGHLVYCEGFRVADVTGYGYDETCIAYPALLNTFQRLDLVTITDCCFMLQGQRDFATKNPDKTIYSVTRVDEWRMNSRLLPVAGNVTPVTGQRTDANPQGNTIGFYRNGVRNYVGFYNNVHFLGCMVSNDLFNAGFRGADGVYHNTNEYTGQDFDDPYNYYNIKAGGSDEKDKSLSYFNEKMMYIQKYYADYKMPNTEVATSPRKDEIEANRLEFKKRNVGTARNLIGVNNGYTLRIQNEQKPTHEQYTPLGGTEKVSKTTDNGFYYGPIVGVMEVKLLTAVQGEGGGYVYADNVHAEKVDAQGKVIEDPTNMNEHDNAHFMNRSGNFVFPGVMNNDASNPQYVVDNCYPTHFEDSHAKHAPEANNTNDNSADIECHYWYLDGYNYFYNAVLTGYTYNGTGTFRLNQEEQALLFNGVDDDLPVYLKSLVWKDEGVHLDDDGSPLYVKDKDGNDVAYTSDIEGMNTNLKKGNGDTFTENPYDFHLYLGTYPVLGEESSYNGWQREMENPGKSPNLNWGPYSDQCNPTDPGAIRGSGVDNDKYYKGHPYNPTKKEGEMPVLGIQLVDPVDNNPKDNPRYFQEHMEQPIKVQMVFVMPERTLDGGEIVPEHTYTVNLTIAYVQGPRIDGFPKITNCALPGEMITATSEGIEITADEGMPVTPGSLKWMLRPLKDRTDFSQGWANAATYEIPAIFSKTDLTGSVYTATYPALHYQDKWDFAFQFSAGGNEFDVYTSNDTEATYHYEMVHNYHSMKRVNDMMGVVPVMGSTINFDLKPIAGSRIYIEDTEDLLKFMKYVETLQYTGRTYVEADGFKEGDPHIGTEYKGMPLAGAPENFGYGHPKNAEGLEFYLMTDLDLTTDAAATSINNILGGSFDWNAALAQFAGQFHGMGHTITLPADKQFSLAGAQMEDHVNYLQLLHKGDIATYQDKRGKTAYDKNFDYLDERYHLGKDIAKERETPTIPAEGSFYVEDYFKNGDYRYATFKVMNDDFDESTYVDGAHLRSERMPNYGSDESHHHYHADFDEHIVYHAPDLLRVDTHVDGDGNTVYDDTYHPLFNHVVPATVKDVKDQDVDVTDLDLAENDVVNDYIFFGQDLSKDKDQSVTASITNMPRSILRSDYLYGGTYGNDGIDPLGEPRIHRASGFRHTKFDEGFYFNEDAYVGDDYLTAVSFMPYGEYAEGYPDTAPTGATMPAGYQGVYYAPQLDMPGLGLKRYDQNEKLTKNFLVYTPSGDANYSPASGLTAPTYTHYLQGKNNSFSLTAGLNYENNKAESEIIGHHIIGTTNGTTSNASIDYFHLVDKQDFNAPYAFTVNSRAWYERMPDRWRNVSGTGESYSNASAWEGICLPFTAKRVIASENKEISHFYGTDINDDNHPNANDHTLHHEYWLSGLVEMSDGGDPETKTALMARPSTSGTSLFTDATGNRQEVATSPGYAYPPNTYFTSLTNYTDYHDNDYDDGDTDGDEWIRSDQEWYKSSHTFADYVYLSKTVPYIIAFPGNDFYEFSMEGTGYDRDRHEKDKTKPQLVTFETPTATIAVSDDETGDRTSTANGYNHVGTYMLKNTTATQAPSQLGNGLAMNASGTKFEAKSDTDPDATFDYVLPFRTYMSAPSTTSPAPASRSILINGGSEEKEKDIEIDLEDDKDNAIPALSIRIKGLQVIVTSTFEDVKRVNVYSVKGQLLRVHDAPTGVSEFRLPTPGLYIINGVKVTVR